MLKIKDPKCILGDYLKFYAMSNHFAFSCTVRMLDLEFVLR
jgi:hypothetical protein